MNARRSLLFGSSVILGTLLTLPVAARTSGPPGGPPSIEAKPVAGVTVAPGKKLGCSCSQNTAKARVVLPREVGRVRTPIRVATNSSAAD